MVGWNSSAKFWSVNRPSASWKPPSARYVVGRTRKRRAKAKNGTTPSHVHESPARGKGPGVAGWRASAGAMGGERPYPPPPVGGRRRARRSLTVGRLLHVGADDGVPLLGDDLLGLVLLLE